MTIKLIKLKLVKLEIVNTGVTCHGDVIGVNSTFIVVVQLIPLAENVTSHCYFLP
ncbi:MAG: hypothetical protein WBL44_12630 [Nitrososphaeraceae archaeon]|jgi:hypothetical protein